MSSSSSDLSPRSDHPWTAPPPTHQIAKKSKKKLAKAARLLLVFVGGLAASLRSRCLLTTDAKLYRLWTCSLQQWFAPRRPKHHRLRATEPHHRHHQGFDNHRPGRKNRRVVGRGHRPDDAVGHLCARASTSPRTSAASTRPMERDLREYELRKSISLAQLDPAALYHLQS
jgi:hypothetical protein